MSSRKNKEQEQALEAMDKANACNEASRQRLLAMLPDNRAKAAAAAARIRRKRSGTDS